MLNTNTYQRFRAIAIRRLDLIENGGEGAVLTITRKTSAYNPVTKRVETVEVVYTTSGLRNNYKMYDWKNSSIQDTDVNFYIHPISTTMQPDSEWTPSAGETEEDRPLVEVSLDTPEITPTDVIGFLGEEYTVINTRPWNHAGILIGYKVQARVM